MAGEQAQGVYLVDLGFGKAWVEMLDYLTSLLKALTAATRCSCSGSSSELIGVI